MSSEGQISLLILGKGRIYLTSLLIANVTSYSYKVINLQKLLKLMVSTDVFLIISLATSFISASYLQV